MSGVTRRLLAVANRTLAPLELELTRRRRYPRASTEGVLAQARALGVSPRSVIDVGAAYGDWSHTCSRLFPDAHYLLVEPLSEFASLLKERAKRIPNAVYVPAAAAASAGTLTLRVHPDLVGSSSLAEHDDPSLVERAVPSLTVDELVQRERLPAPFLLKIDVQGGELEVLAGARATMEKTVLAILEVSFLGFFVGGPQLADVVAAMKERGFAAYDLANVLYRPLDGALAQADLAFVPESSPLRSRQGFAEPEQRAASDKRLRALYERRLGALGPTADG